MREIKFRGLWGDQFIYGSFLKQGDLLFICPDEGILTNRQILVHPESVGQYTGLKDLNGNEIYEGDIIIRDEKPVVVSFVNQCFLLVDKYEASGREYERHFFLDNQCRVIGNIHLNPELS